MPSHSEESVLVGPTGSLPTPKKLDESEGLRQKTSASVIANLGVGPAAESNSAILQALITKSHLGDRAVFEEIGRLYGK